MNSEVRRQTPDSEVRRTMSEVSLKSEVWNGKWGVSLWLLYKLNNVKRVIAWQERIDLVKVQCPNITELVVCVLYLWLSQRFRIKAKQNKKTCGWEINLCTWADPEQNVLPFSFERFFIRSSYSFGGILFLTSLLNLQLNSSLHPLLKYIINQYYQGSFLKSLRYQK